VLSQTSQSEQVKLSHLRQQIEAIEAEIADIEEGITEQEALIFQ